MENYKLKKYRKIFETIYKNGKKIIKFCNKIKKQNFHQHKRAISIKNIDISKMIVSNKVSFDKKMF